MSLGNQGPLGLKSHWDSQSGKEDWVLGRECSRDLCSQEASPGIKSSGSSATY